MRLLNSKTYTLEEFSGTVPEYAILSHTWEAEELSFQGIQDPDAKKKPGFAKIEGSCAQARRDAFEYVWIDTCCIDKTSSAELSEAINSMYQWYKEAQVCYTYLADVPSGEDQEHYFARSRWFTRGWTLQELIAPSSLVFYGGDWCEIGTKMSLQNSVADITGIPIPVLKHGGIEDFSVAQKMSWASKRQTTRIEDMAYCLMGLFGVNMPMLYGEGQQAFRRLQEEIMKTSDDHTLFAWMESKLDKRRWVTRGLLADSALEFVHSGDITRSLPVLKDAPYTMTNKGLRIELPLLPSRDNIRFAVLNCQRSADELNSSGRLVGIFLKRIASSQDEYFARAIPDRIYPVTKEKINKCKQEAVYIIHKNVAEDPSFHEPSRVYQFHISISLGPSSTKNSNHISEFYSSFTDSRMLKDGSFLFIGRQTGLLAALKVKYQKEKHFVVVLGRHEGLPWCDIAIEVMDKSLVAIYDAYWRKTHANLLDRVEKPLQPGISVSLAIRRIGKSQKTSENYDGEYVLHILRNVTRQAHQDESTTGSSPPLT